MKSTYDPSANVAYIPLRERQGDVEATQLTADFLVDIEKARAVRGVELRTKRRLKGANCH